MGVAAVSYYPASGGTPAAGTITSAMIADGTIVAADLGSIPESSITNLTTDLAAKAATATQVIAGAGLTGGGTLAADRTLAVGAGTGITVNADDVAVNASVLATDGFGACTDVTTNNATTSLHGFAPKATAPAAGLLSVLAIGNGATVRSDTAIFDTTNPAALGTVGPGTALVAARRDHIHANPALDTLAAPTDITTLDASTTVHGLVVKATAPASGLINVVGIGNAETAYTNKPLFDATTPAALAAAAAVGTATVAARRDHVHALPAIDALAAATDILTANASTSAHGLLKKLSNVSTEFMNGVGSWATPASTTDITGMTDAARSDFKNQTDYIPVYDVSASANKKFLLSDMVNPRNGMFLFTDLLETTVPTWLQLTTFASTATTEVARPGIYTATINSGASGTAGFTAVNSQAIMLGGGKWRYVCLFKTPAVSDGTVTYVVRVGIGGSFTNNIGSEPTNGVYLYYTHANNSAKWELRAQNASSQTVADTGIAYGASAWTAIELEINAAGTSCDAWINGVHSSNAVTGLPTAAIGYGFGCRETAGATDRIFLVDAIGLMFEPTSAR